MDDLTRLLSNRRDDLRVAMASVGHADAGGEIEPAITLPVPDVTAFAAFDENGGIAAQHAGNELGQILNRPTGHADTSCGGIRTPGGALSPSTADSTCGSSA